MTERVQINLRLPRELHERVIEQARLLRQSRNQWITEVLRQVLDLQEKVRNA